MNVKAVSSRFFSLICLLGFVLQLQQISELYFRYQTTSKSQFQIRDMEYYQTIIFCPRFAEILNRTNHQHFRIRPTPPTSLHELEDDLRNLTIKNILELTPKESDVVFDCVRRDGNMSTLVQMTKAECEHFFKITKSVSGEKVCYTFMTRNRTVYSIGDVASSLTHTNIVFAINLLQNLGKAVFVNIISEYMYSDEEKDALESRIYQARILNKRSFNKSQLVVYGEFIEVSRLPPPYDTRCTPGHDPEVCYEDCLFKRFKEINRIPWSGFYKRKINVKMLTYTDLKNKSISSFASTSFYECHKLCKRQTECYTAYSKTIAQEYVEIISALNLAITAMVPSGPSISVYSVALLTPVEFLIQIGSCVGVWFGLSIISFNPVKWKILTKNATTKTTNNRSRTILNVSRIPRLRKVSSRISR